jgi:predicted DNA-binding transcriptional regulator AlpA
MFSQEIEAMKDVPVDQVFYTPTQLAKLLGVGMTKFYEIVKADGFPKPTSHPLFNNRYNYQDVMSWLYQSQDAA